MPIRCIYFFVTTIGYLPALPALAVLTLLLEVSVISPLLEALDLEVMQDVDNRETQLLCIAKSTDQDGAGVNP